MKKRLISIFVSILCFLASSFHVNAERITITIVQWNDVDKPKIEGANWQYQFSTHVEDDEFFWYTADLNVSSGQVIEVVDPNNAHNTYFDHCSLYKTWDREIVSNGPGNGTTVTDYYYFYSPNQAGNGTDIRNTESFIWEIGIGFGDNLYIHGDFVSSQHYSPSELKSQSSYFDQSAAVFEDVIYQPDGTTYRQILQLGNLIDIVVVDSNKYEMRFYDDFNLPAQSGDLYTFNGSPNTTWVISNPDAGSQNDPQNKLRIQKYENDGAGSNVLVDVSIVESDGANNTNKYYYGENPTSYEEYVEDSSSGDTVKTKLIRSIADNSILRKEVSIYHKYVNSGTERLIKEEFYEPGTTLVYSREFNYYDDPDPAHANNYDRLKWEKSSNGDWTKYEYDEFGYVSKSYHNYLDVVVSDIDLADNTNSRVVTKTNQLLSGSVVTILELETVPVSGAPVTVRKIEKVETLESHPISGDPVIVITSKNHMDNTGTNFLASIEKYFQNTATLNRGRLYFEQSADGQIKEYATDLTPYNPLTGEQSGSGSYERKITTYFTVNNPTPTANKTIRDIIIKDGDDVLFEEKQIYNGSTFETLHQIRHEYEPGTSDLIKSTRFNSPGETAANGDGRVIYSAEYAYDYYTLESTLQYEIDELGVKTQYIDLDGFSRAIKEGANIGGNQEADIITTSYTQNGKLTLVTEEDSNGSFSNNTSYDYHLSGAVQQITRNGLTTSYSDSEGSLISTETLSNGGTIITENYPDGQLKSISGTAARPRYYEYSVDTSGNKVTKEYQGLDANALNWTETTTDWAGNVIKEVKTAFDSDNNSGTIETLTTNYDYNSKSQLVKIRQDGVVDAESTPGIIADTLITYNEYGNVEYRGQDMNGNGLLEENSTDRLTKNEELYLFENSNWCRVNRIYAYNSDSSSVATLLSESKEKLSGFASNEISKVTDTDVNGIVTITSTTVDLANKIVFVTTDPSNADSYQAVAINGLILSSEGPNQSEPTIYTYDDLGRIQSVTDPTTGTRWTTYNDNGQPLHVSNSDLNGTSYVYYQNGEMGAGQVKYESNAADKRIYFEYNEFDQLIRRWGTATYPIQFAYDSVTGQLTDMWTYQDDSAHDFTTSTWPASATQANGNRTKWIYDNASTLLKSKEDASGASTDYAYYNSGLLRNRTNARSQETEYQYEIGGQLIKVDYDPSNNTIEVIRTIGRNGRPIAIADDSGSRSITYTSSGQIDDEIYTSGILNGYAINRSFETTGEHIGKRSGLSLNSGSLYSESYAYQTNTGSRLSSITAAGNTATYAYRPNTDLITSLSYNNGSTNAMTIDKLYDHLGRLKNVVATDSSDATLLGHSNRYNSLSQRDRVMHNDGTKWVYSYNDRKEIDSGDKQLVDGTAISGQDFNYSYDATGNRTGGYTADSLNQYDLIANTGEVSVAGVTDSSAVITADVGGNAATVTRTNEHFHVNYVDSSGNAAYHAVNVFSDLDPGNPATGSMFLAPANVVPQYDADGNLTQDARWNYEWNEENRLTAMEVKAEFLGASSILPVDKQQRLEFAYDSEGRRFSKKVFEYDGSAFVLQTTTHFIYNGWNLIYEVTKDSTDTIIEENTYTWGTDLSGAHQGAGGVGGLLMATFDDQAGNPQDVFYVSDANGNVVSVVDADSETVVASYDYGPFGETVRASGPLAKENRMRFSSKYQDEESSLYYYGYRYYDVTAGRWISRDPYNELGSALSRGEGFVFFGINEDENLYRFVNNDGINLIDILGLYSACDERCDERWPNNPRMRDLCKSNCKPLGSCEEQCDYLWPNNPQMRASCKEKCNRENFSLKEKSCGFECEADCIITFATGYARDEIATQSATALARRFLKRQVVALIPFAGQAKTFYDALFTVDCIVGCAYK